MDVDDDGPQDTPLPRESQSINIENQEESKPTEDEKLEDECTVNFSQGTSKEIRWRKEDDKKLFATYRILCRKQMLNLREVVSVPLKKNKKHK